jgi:hypothetical protein
MDTKLRTELRADGWIVNEDGVCVAKMNDGWHEYQESAAFIVRACNAHDDLLAACKAAVELLEANTMDDCTCDAGDGAGGDIRCVPCQLRAAIAAAEGGQG